MNTAERQRVVEALWPKGATAALTRVFAVLDGARDDRIEPMIRERTNRGNAACLYSGRLSPALAAAAPYLVHLAYGAPLTHEILEQGWGRSWGIFTVVPAEVTLDQQRRHFKNMLRVKDSRGRWLVFRYYDPRVLRAYLPTCTALEALQFFGPVPRIVVEGEAPRSLLRRAGRADAPRR